MDDRTYIEATISYMPSLKRLKIKKRRKWMIELR